ncbi:hypothetical protein LCGC14_1701110, partial [marine sediment metagenome]
MRVLLINPRTDNMARSSVPGFVNKLLGTNPVPPLGLLYVAAYALKAHHHVEVIDMVAEGTTLLDLQKYLYLQQPEIVGITTTTLNLYDALDVAKEVKRAEKLIPVVMGGPHLSLYPDETLNFRAVDYVIQGEGEVLFTELLEELDPQGHPPTLPDWEVYPYRDRAVRDKYKSTIAGGKQMTTMITSRGCPYRCSFCYQPPDGKWWARTALSVFEEMQACVNMGIDEIEIYDDTFTHDRQRVMRLCSLIVDAGLRVNWNIRTRVGSVDQAMLAALSKAGCRRINYGIESIHDNVLRAMGKGQTIRQSEDALRWTK